MKRVDIQACENRADLVEWLKDNLPGSSLQNSSSGIVIYTGLNWDMNGDLYPIEGANDER